MNRGWLITFAVEDAARPQVSIASEGGLGTTVTDLSIDMDAVRQPRAKSDRFGKLGDIPARSPAPR